MKHITARAQIKKENLSLDYVRSVGTIVLERKPRSLLARRGRPFVPIPTDGANCRCKKSHPSEGVNSSRYKYKNKYERDKDLRGSTMNDLHPRGC